MLSHSAFLYTQLSNGWLFGLLIFLELWCHCTSSNTIIPILWATQEHPKVSLIACEGAKINKTFDSRLYTNDPPKCGTPKHA